jgi:hypothetical protein
MSQAETPGESNNLVPVSVFIAFGIKWCAIIVEDI